jgi:hypothetical protein
MYPPRDRKRPCGASIAHTPGALNEAHRLALLPCRIAWRRCLAADTEREAPIAIRLAAGNGEMADCREKMSLTPSVAS